MKLPNKYFISLKNCQTILAKVETLTSLPASLKRAKEACKLLDNALHELNTLTLQNLDIAAYLKDIEQKIVNFYGKVQDLYMDARVDELVFMAMSIKSAKEKRLYDKKLSNFLKNHRPSSKQLQKLKAPFDHENKQRGLSLEETENLLEACFLIAERAIPYAKEYLAKLSPDSQEKIEEERIQLKAQDLFICPKKGALALFRVYSEKLGLYAKKPGMKELEIFLKERKAIDCQEVKTAKIVCFKAVI